MSREMKRLVSSRKGGFSPSCTAGDIGSELPPSQAGNGLIVNSLVTDWGWGTRLQLGQRHLWGGSMQTAVSAGLEAIL